MLKKFTERVLLSAPHMSGREMHYIQLAFQDNWIVPLGPNVTNFEKSVTAYLKQADLSAVATSSGTAALHIALRLLNVHQGEEIFCASATFMATANPVLYEKAIPVFIDSENETWNLCPKSLLKAIEAKKKTGKVPRILIAVDLFGMSADYDAILEICNQYGITLIEDAAESLGSTYKGRACGSFGKYGVLSFNGNKIITTSGGGMLLCHSQEEADKSVFLITQARDKAPYYLHSQVGYNYRLSNVCAGIGIGQMEVLQNRVETRRQHYETYSKYFHDSPLVFKTEPEWSRSNHWLSTALINSSSVTPTSLIGHLAQHNVEARHIWKPLHTQPIFKGCEFFAVDAKPVAENIFEKGICLPSGSDLSQETILQICDIIKAAF